MYYLCEIEYIGKDNIFEKNRIMVEANNFRGMIEEIEKNEKENGIMLLSIELLRFTKDKEISYNFRN